MASKTYTITMTFTSDRRPDWVGSVTETLKAKTHIEPTLAHYRGWLAAHNRTETSLLIVDSDGHVLYDSKPRQETEHEISLIRAASGRTATAHWDWPGLN